MQTARSGSGSSGGGVKGCGCGGNCGGGCGCKPARLPESAPAICSPCETASFVRPRFFAGQLLTEDDLGALIDYVVAKNRFHNARLFGEGVVCGLEVECGPCDRTQIVVKPGYALDCCGNDLVLTCERTLDVAPMIRALAAQRDGGCTDPCPPPAPASSPPAGTPKKQDNAKPNKHYCLYARYAERPDQPVAAYPVGDDCDAASCEPTRIVEGIVFELRCPAECKPLTVHDAMKDCADEIDPEGLISAAAAGLKSAAVALPAFSGVKAAAYSRDELEALHEGSRDIDAIVAGSYGPERVLAFARYLTAVAGPYSRHQALPELELPQAVNAKQIETNAAVAAGALAQLEEADYEKLSPLEAATVRASLHGYRLVQDKDYKSIEGQAFLLGASASAEILELGAAQLDEIAARLRRYAGCGKRKTHADCTLDELIENLKPGWSTKGNRKLDYTIAKQQLSDAADAVARFLLDCACAAINPPCAPCDDPGVLLACFEVEDCKVVKICNTVRCYVLAPTTLRYWGLFDTAEAFAGCCEDRPADDAAGRTTNVREGYGLAPPPKQFLYAPDTQRNLAHLRAVAAPADLRARLVPKLAIRSPAPANEAEIASLRRQLAAVTSRLDQLEGARRAERSDKPDKKEK